MNQERQKEVAARRAVDAYIRKGMKLGLGSGSTSMHAVRYLGGLYNEGKLPGIRAVATSFQTEIACQELGIPLFELNSPEIGAALDLAIDGADEIDPAGNLIKGGGGAQLREKIVAYNATRFIVIADESKLVDNLALKFPLPIEVVMMARLSVTKALEALGATVVLRQALRKAGPVVTDNGNLLLDITFPEPIDPPSMEKTIAMIPGVVESGLFTVNRPIVVIAYPDGSVSGI